MTKLHAELVPRPPFVELPFTPSSEAGVIGQDRDGTGIASVLVRRGGAAALTHQIKERFGIELAAGSRRSASGNIAFIATGPGSWFATSEGAGNAFVVSLAQALGDCASIADQSDGQAVLRLSGPKVRDTLCKLVPVDLHPRAFAVGDVAVTVAAHMGATLWRLKDEPSGHPVFEVAVYRSLAESFWSALMASAAEFGFKMSEHI